MGSKVAAMADDETTKLTVKLPTPLARQLKVAAITNDATVQDFVAEALISYLARLEESESVTA